MDIKQEKSFLRKQIRQQQKLFSLSSVVSSDKQILKQVMALPAYQSAKTLFCFVGTPNEINTKLLICDAIAQGKRVAVPLCVDKGIMHAVQISGPDDLETGSFGILEPKNDCSPILKEEIDFVIVPCISCDRDGNRLGQGGGYYDRFLADGRFITAALCREKLLLDKVPVEAWDQPVDMVVTEKTVYIRNKEC